MTAERKQSKFLDFKEDKSVIQHTDRAGLPLSVTLAVIKCTLLVS